ncbi:hypothetical protein ANCDUO_16410 [Ancylostoma duodenale]|uniref:Uncharacterized protein n=1 Tax=Ancylostoma duodenale TaxID=51022 RepID=A0A0C2FY11_9BILA|nr:hypothetical protein ANCDUO_16410 [Ancylostoma duodenale]
MPHNQAIHIPHPRHDPGLQNFAGPLGTSRKFIRKTKINNIVEPPLEKCKKERGVQLPSYWPFALREILQLLLTWFTIGFFILDVSLACSLAEDASIAFTRRYIITLFLWIAITEPLKGMLCAYIILKRNPSHFVSCEFDEAILPLEYAEKCGTAPECLRNDVVGTTESDLKQLQDNKDKKTREELFFETMRGVACLLASLVVIMGLVFYYRDNTGFLYQQQVRSLLNLEQIPYGPVAFGSINQIEQFWTWARDSLAPGIHSLLVGTMVGQRGLCAVSPTTRFGVTPLIRYRP